jgi:hypothetical protein
MGQSFGARFAIAPDVHMFYVIMDMNNAFKKDPPVFDQWLKRLPKARKFENPTNRSEKLVIGVRRGKGVSFNTDLLTNTANLKWFTDKFIYSDNRYINGTSKPSSFYMAGMDLLHGQYALPQEQAYRSHLISVGPLAGNLI